ncbi:MAG: hypothetical protein ACRDRW_05370 [Pseudonocardiaceae bacterium]
MDADRIRRLLAATVLTLRTAAPTYRTGNIRCRRPPSAPLG